MLQVTATAIDPELPANELSFNLNQGPNVLTIGSSTGIISWSPNIFNEGGLISVEVVVLDNGVPILDDSEFFAVFVNPIGVSTDIVQISMTEHKVIVTGLSGYNYALKNLLIWISGKR